MKMKSLRRQKLCCTDESDSLFLTSRLRAGSADCPEHPYSLPHFTMTQLLIATTLWHAPVGDLHFVDKFPLRAHLVSQSAAQNKVVGCKSCEAATETDHSDIEGSS